MSYENYQNKKVLRNTRAPT